MASWLKKTTAVMRTVATATMPLMALGGSRPYCVKITGTIATAMTIVTHTAVVSVAGECGSSWHSVASEVPAT